MKKFLGLLALATLVALTFEAYIDTGKSSPEKSPQLAQAQNVAQPGGVIMASNEVVANIEVIGKSLVPNSQTAIAAEVNSLNQEVVNTAESITGNNYNMVMSLANKNELQMANNSGGTYNFSTIEDMQSLAMVNMVMEESSIKKVNVNTTTKNPVAAKGAIPGEVMLISTNTARMA